MKKLVLFVVAILYGSIGIAKEKASILNVETITATTEVNKNNSVFKDSIIIKKGYQLTLKNKDPKLSQEFKNNIAERFFIVYPKMLEHFNPKASKNVMITFSDEDVDHPAHAMNNEITRFTNFFPS